MSERIVDDLELIEIDIQQCVRFVTLVPYSFERADQVILEFAAINETRQAVMRGLVTELAEQARFFADIMEHHDRADDIADAITNGCRRVLNRNLFAIPRNQNRVFCERNDTTFLQTAYYRVFDRSSRMLVNDHHDLCHAGALCTADVPAREVLRDGINVIDIAVRVCRNDAVADRLQSNLRSLLLFEHTRFRVFAIRDIRDSAFVCSEPAFVVVDGPRVFQDDDLATILTSQPVFKILDDTFRLETRQNALAIDWIHIKHRRHTSGFELLDTVVSEHLHESRVRRNDFAFA